MINIWPHLEISKEQWVVKSGTLEIDIDGVQRAQKGKANVSH